MDNFNLLKNKMSEIVKEVKNRTGIEDTMVIPEISQAILDVEIESHGTANYCSMYGGYDESKPWSKTITLDTPIDLSKTVIFCFMRAYTISGLGIVLKNQKVTVDSYHGGNQNTGNSALYDVSATNTTVTFYMRRSHNYSYGAYLYVATCSV